MVRRIKKLTGLAVVLALAVVISLPKMIFAATSPVVTTLGPVLKGLAAPVKLVMDASGNYYVADQRLGVIKFDPYGKQLLTIKTEGYPMGVALGQDGKLLVSQGKFIAAYNTNDGTESSRFSHPLMKAAGALVVDEIDGFIYVADGAANEVQVYNAAGGYSKSIGTGSRSSTGMILPAGQLSMPTGIAIEKVSHKLAVADTLNSRIQFFDLERNGQFDRSIGLAPTGSPGPLFFTSPQAVAFEYTGGAVPAVSRMYVADTSKSKIQVIDPAGNGTALIFPGASDNYIGTSGTASGQVMIPTDVVFDQKSNRLIVVNGNENVSLFGIDGGFNPVDLTPPSLGIDPLLTTVYVANITISGTVGSGAQVSVTSDTGALVGAVIYPTATTWKCDIASLTAGANTFSITAKNSAGIATPAQSATVSYIMPAPALSVSSLIPAVTKVSRLVLTGAVDAGSAVTVTNTATAASGNATVTGTEWSFAVDLSEGVNNFSIAAQKEFSAKAAAAVAVTLDTVSPILKVSALSNGSYTSTRVQNISGSVADAGTVSVLVNNVPAVLDGSTFSASVTLNNGGNDVVVFAADAAGNSVADARVLYFDASTPVITVASPMDNSYTSSSHLDISGIVDETATVTIAGVYAQTDGSNRWNGSVDLVAGSNTIEIVAVDLAGNSSSIKRTVTFDVVSPAVSITSPKQDTATNDPDVTITGLVADNSSVVLTYSLNGVTTPVPVVDGSFTFKVTFADEGTYPVIVNVVDPAGNTARATRNLIYDITPPKLSVQSYPGYAPSKINGTVEAGATVVVKENDIAIGKVTTVGTKWSVDLSRTRYNPKKLTVVATDAAGNSTTKSFMRR